MMQSYRRRRSPLSLATAALLVVIASIMPPNLMAFLAVNPKFLPTICSQYQNHPLWTISNGVGLESSSQRGQALSPIEQAQQALKNLDVQSAETFLMAAVAEVNGAVMNNPPLLQCFEDLFRTKIKIAQEETNHQNESLAYGIAQDRMGLASLLTDQSKYQEAADELEMAVRSLSVLASSGSVSSDVILALDKASSLLFRTRAMVCDWGTYETSCQDLSRSTQRALSEGVLPSVHPFEALAWPCLSLEDATSIAHKYGKRALATSTSTTTTTTSTTTVSNARANLPWTNLNDRIPRERVPFVRAITESPRAGNSIPSKASNHEIIRVGYLSPDFTGRHPLAFLMQDVFRFHDNSKFEIILYSLGGDPDGSPEVERIIHGRDERDMDGPSRTWKTLEGSIEAMAQTISEDNLDVLIDLCGYTGTSLVAEVMACLRCLGLSSDGHTANKQPVHVGYMGFPGSSGAPYIDYMIADHVVIPSKFRPLYTENILYMPHCYFVNSHWHIRNANNNNDNNDNDNNNNNDESKQNSITTERRRREHFGLPPAPAFVFCCHSRPDKIDPSTFATWIRALKRTRARGRQSGNQGMAKSVLWLLRSPGAPQMEENLLNTAQTILGENADTVDDAIVFCDHAPRDEHLDRLALADLYLDTPAYNAHTVGCDCLSAGVPMISLLLPHHHNHEPTKIVDDAIGGSNAQVKIPTDKLASRVGASLLKSAGSSSLLLDSLVVSSMEEYEDRMVEIASCDSIHSCTFLKQHLLDEFPKAPLWDTERWVRNLETGLVTMVDLATKGSHETDIYVMDYNDAVMKG